MNRLSEQVATLNTNFQLFDRKADQALKEARQVQKEIDDMKKQEINEMKDHRINEKDRKTKYITTILAFALPIILSLILSGISITK